MSSTIQINHATQTANRLIAIAMVAAITLATLFFCHHGPSFDEPWYLSTLGLLHQKGLSVDFIRSLPGPAGPLYTLVHVLFEPLTHRVLPGVRIVNLALFYGCLIWIFALAKQLKLANPALIACMLCGAPMIWPVAGLALTEMPALFFLLAGVYLMLLNRGSFHGYAQLALSILAGVFLALSVSGRQTCFVVVPAIWLWSIFDRPRRASLIAASILPLLTMAILFKIWGSFSPRDYAPTGEGLSISPSSGLLTLMYAGVVMLVWSPRWFLLRPSIILLVAFGTIVLNWFTRVIVHPPLYFVAQRHLSPQIFDAYGRITGGIMLSLGILLTVSGVLHFWRVRKDPVWMFIFVFCALAVASSMKITHVYSSRYVVPALPALLLMAAKVDPSPRPKWLAIRLAIGACVGAISLHGFVNTAGGLPVKTNAKSIVSMALPPDAGRLNHAGFAPIFCRSNSANPGGNSPISLVS